MRVVGIEGLCGGVGATSVAAGLAVALNEMAVRTIALDLNAQNHLGLLFGMPLEQLEGLVNQPGPLVNSVLETHEGYPFMPMGVARSVQERARFEASFAQRMEPILATKERILVVDAPAAPGPLREWLDIHADLMIHVIQPEPRAVPALLAFERDRMPQQEASGRRARILINGVAPHLQLANDMLVFLQSEIHRDRLVPVVIHRDQHVAEAFAKQQPLVSYQYEAQAARDYDALALWLIGYLAQHDHTDATQPHGAS
ncbi:cellulose synthase operon protein YhjQ/BcsQ [Aliidiomarina sanyensis]|uniref:Cellulose synthase operon protein YhjQ n=1 Tax=Aliidiomarina sanyensis TaxID=1249555 RepID=A0A432WQ21_9GAMM|nr:cellulose synthase operon protein YhjQ/BcsQ [Aliidiomarina sanyensis]RUO35777.1 hypothetical protein CWE11_03190 [Aliidiomarina sanyensis]